MSECLRKLTYVSISVNSSLSRQILHIRSNTQKNKSCLKSIIFKTPTVQVQSELLKNTLSYFKFSQCFITEAYLLLGGMRSGDGATSRPIGKWLCPIGLDMATPLIPWL
jgi:hypothetical protein